MKFLNTLALCTILALNAYSQNNSTSCKCCTEAHQQFDFWAGNWETFGPKGNLVGTNDIKWLQDSCILQENWTSAQGIYTGTSYNFYDVATQQWHQTWVDNQGGNLLLKGAWNGKSMVLKSEALDDGKGGSFINRITWTPNKDGSVRQHWEISNDNEETWTTAFDGLYKLKETED